MVYLKIITNTLLFNQGSRLNYVTINITTNARKNLVIGIGSVVKTNIILFYLSHFSF
jgi:hypothetical protein